MKTSAFVLAGAVSAGLAVLLGSCASGPAAPGPSANRDPDVQRPADPVGVPAPFLPLAEGWYLYDFERTLKGIEDEYNFALSMGMKMTEELTLRQSGTVSWCENGVLYDPALEMELAVDKDGRIRSIGNPGITGTLSENGDFYWSGQVEQQGRLNHVSVRGKLIYLPRGIRGGSEYDGVYRLVDSGTGREQFVRIQDGFYTWQYSDGGEAGFTPWPTLIKKDGSFEFGMDMATVLAMGDVSRSDYSTGVIIRGQLGPAGITLEELSHTSGLGTQGSAAPRIYAGTAIRDGEFPNEKIPRDAGSLIRPKVAAAQDAAPIDWSRYPPWYRSPPEKAGFIYASGEKKFQNQDTAFAMAEAAAAADIAVRLRARVTSRAAESSNTGTRLDSRIELEALENIPYRVVEKLYLEGAAFVLVELDLSSY